MPFDGTHFEVERQVDAQAIGGTIATLVVGALLGGLAVFYGCAKSVTMAPAPLAESTKAALTAGQCDLREIPLGTPAEAVRQLCGEPGKSLVNPGHQWVYGSTRYAYVENGALVAWQWDGEDSYTAASVPTVVSAPGSLAGAPGDAVWHQTTDVYLDSSGKEISRSTGTHLVNAEFCHPGYRP